MMHSNEGVSGGAPAPATGAALLLELGTLIVSSRASVGGGKSGKGAATSTPTHQRQAHGARNEPGTSGAWNDAQLHHRILAAKLLNRSSQEKPSTSTGIPQLPITDVRAKVAALSRENSGLIQASAVSTAVARARRALFIDKHLKGHVEGLWNEHIPLSIEVLLGPDCPECYARAPDHQDPDTGQAEITRDGSLLIERWTLSIYHKKAHENTQQITSQWLLNAVRSQLHFSQISAWNAKIQEDSTKVGRNAENISQESGETRQRKLSRETCNFKKLESNCDDPQLLRSSGSFSIQKEQRNLNIVYSLKIPGETYKMAEFHKTPVEHTFPVTDIGSNVFLKVTLESMPRTDDIPIIRCACTTGSPGSMKRRRSKECLTLDEFLSLSDGSEGYDLRCKGATFSPDLTIINPNMGCSSGISRRLSIFTNPENLDYHGGSLSRGSTPEKQLFNDSGFPCSRNITPSEENCSSQCKKPLLDPSLYSKVPGDNVFQTNFMLVDDRMQTACSESGKHRCYCDEEPEQSGMSGIRKIVTSGDDTKTMVDQKYLKDLAKQRRKLRKEIKLNKLRESGGTSESRDDDKNLELESNCDKFGSHFHKRYGGTTTSIPILQASRFDRFLGSFRQPALIGRKASCVCNRKVCAAACCAGSMPCNCHLSVSERQDRKIMISVSTQTEPMQCECGGSILARCKECDDFFSEDRSHMKRSDGSHDLVGISKSKILLEAMERTSRLHELTISDSPCSSGTDNISSIKEEAGNKARNCDNNLRNSINGESDIIYDRLEGSDSFKALSNKPTISNLPNDERSFIGLIKRPKLKRLTPIVDRIDKVLTDRVHIKSKMKDEDFVPKEDNCVLATTKDEATPLNRRKNSSTSDDDFIVYEHGDYGTFASPDGSYDPIEDMDMVQRGDADVPSSSDMVRFRWRLDSAASMVFHANTGLPLTSSPAPLKRGNTCFDYDSSINSVSSIRSALFHPSPDCDQSGWSPGSSPGSPASMMGPPIPWLPRERPSTPPPRLAGDLAQKASNSKKIRLGPRSGLLGTFEESALKGRLEPAATVAGFTAELGASGAFCPPHKRLPVTVFFYSLGGNAAPYLGHINLGRRGYNVPKSGTVQVTLFNPHGTVVKMFVVLYDLADMPPSCRTFLRQRTLYLPANTSSPTSAHNQTCLRYLIHLRFMTSKSGKLYLHTDIRIIVSRKADLDTAAAHSPLAAQVPLKWGADRKQPKEENGESKDNVSFVRRMNRSEACVNLSAILKDKDDAEMSASSKEVSYELRSFTYAPDNPKFSPR